MIFGRKKHSDGGSATAEASPEGGERTGNGHPDLGMDREQLFAEIESLEKSNRRSRSTEAEREIRRLRHLAGVTMIRDAKASGFEPRHVEPGPSVPDLGPQSRLPEITPADLSAEMLRAAILEHGALLVRGLLDRDKAERMAADIDRSVETRARIRGKATDPEGYYDEMKPEAPYRIGERPWIEEGGGVLAVDSPRLLFDMIESLQDAGLRDVIDGYLGERSAISAQKCTLRKATPDVPGAWHQDGAFMGEVRALNVWISLSDCGEDAPSMDVVPCRLDDFVATGTEGTALQFQVSQQVAEEAAGDVGIVRPIFEPGDALLFDDKFLHQTGSDPSMPNARYAIESWYFGPSSYPMGYVPIAF